MWGLLALIIVVPSALALIGRWIARRRTFGIAARLATRAVAVTGVGFGVLAIVASLSVLRTGLREIRRRVLPDVVSLAAAVSAVDPTDTVATAQQLAVFRARQPEAGPVVAWRDYCAPECLVVAATPEMRGAARAWGSALLRDPAGPDEYATTTAPGDLHLVIAVPTRDARELPDGRLAVAVRATWVSEQVLRTTALLGVIAYALILAVWWLLRAMVASSVASRVRRLVDQLDAAGHGTVPPGPLHTPVGDELGTLSESIRTQIDKWVERQREADRHTADARALAARMESTATLAAGVAHDFNNLMMGVMANSQVLRRDVADGSDAEETLAAIIECADRGGKLAQQLLAFSRGGRYNPTTMDLNAAVRDAVRLESHAFPDPAGLVTDLDDQLLNVEADPTQIGQVLHNLIGNAREALAERGGTVTVRTQNVVLGAVRRPGLENLPAGPYVELSVEDDGCGMTPDTRERVFEPFFTTKRRGRGMGLAAVYGIVMHHGGHIEIESAHDRGTTLVVHLPATTASVPECASVMPGLRRGSGTVLVVDDEAVILAPARRLLERAGYRVLVAENGLEAIDIARGTGDAIDVILLDMRMPVLGGAEAFAPLRTACPRAKIILCSGYELDASAQRLLDAGASAFISKPFLIETLLGEIERALGRDRAAAPSPSQEPGR